MDKFRGLEGQVRIEITNLERVTEEMVELLESLKKERTYLQLRAAGSILHDFYCGIEKIFERIAVSIDNDLPGGENWHIDLLHQMEEPVEGAREKVISEELMKKLKEFLRFRHLFRHIYGFRLTWEKINPLCNDMENVLNKFKEEMNSFFKNGISVIK